MSFKPSFIMVGFYSPFQTSFFSCLLLQIEFMVFAPHTILLPSAVSMPLINTTFLLPLWKYGQSLQETSYLSCANAISHQILSILSPKYFLNPSYSPHSMRYITKSHLCCLNDPSPHPLAPRNLSASKLISLHFVFCQADVMI